MLDNIIKNGGGTYNEFGTEVNVTNGYMVSLEAYEVQIEYGTTSFIDTWKSYVSIYKRHVQSLRLLGLHAYFGAFYNNGIVFIDISINILELSTSLRFAKLENQLSIWDCENNNYIDII